jgi:hypothetical protein
MSFLTWVSEFPTLFMIGALAIGPDFPAPTGWKRLPDTQNGVWAPGPKGYFLNFYRFCVIVKKRSSRGYLLLL